MWGQAAVDLYANPESTLLYVGKRGGQQSTPQAEIESLVVQHCLQVTPPTARHALPWALSPHTIYTFS